MRLRPIVAATLLALAAAAAPATAEPRLLVGPECRTDVVADPTTNGFGGYLSTTAVVRSDDPADPATATVRCRLSYLGDLVATVTGSGTVIHDRTPVWLPEDHDPGYLTTCWQVDFTNGQDPPTYWTCTDHHSGNLLSPLWTHGRPVVDQVPGANDALCDALCDALRAAGPAGGYGYEIDADGNVEVRGFLYWWCDR